jgi:hypothetical protein
VKVLRAVVLRLIDLFRAPRADRDFIDELDGRVVVSLCHGSANSSGDARLALQRITDEKWRRAQEARYRSEGPLLHDDAIRTAAAQGGRTPLGAPDGRG